MRIRTLTAGLLLLGISRAVAMDGGEERFEAKVRPVLAEHCLKCHGPDKQSSDLRLDSREALLKGGSAEGPAIVPGDPEKSPLVLAVRHQGDLKMPPKEKLPDGAARDLADWVKAGAPWPARVTITPAGASGKTHWSFLPVRKSEPPEAGKGTGPIDAFVAAGLASHKLEPAPPADRRTLIRRAAFDLVGLPPTPEEVDAFLADHRPDPVAFAEVVEHYLASPHYGERWGRLWLDVARYADTKGYVFAEETKYPFAYTYRDWVVEAFNEDLPYDQFVLQQVAADKLPPRPDNQHLAALGFLTVGRRFLQDQNEIIDDRIDVVTRGLLGLSVSCARCHDHKFDPIPIDDYYSLYGVFNSSEEPKDLPVLHPASPKDAKDYEAKLAARKKAVDAFVAEKKADLEKELRGRFPAYLAAAEELDFNGRSPKLDEVARGARLRPELVRRAMARWRELVSKDDPRLAPWKALAGLPPGEFAAKSAAKLKELEAGKGKVSPALLKALTGSGPIGSRRELARRYGDVLARSLADKPDPSLADLRRWLDAADGPVAVAAKDLPRLLPKDERNKLRAMEKMVAELDASHPGAPARAMVMVDKPEPIEPRVFLRGNSGRQGKQVPRQFLKVISGPSRRPFTQGSGRLELARAIASKDNPLTARVMVNRVWMYHFGQGLVRTPSDFGVRGDAPTHPELLDWLASAFVDRAWSVKALHRLIMASEAYRRASDATPDHLRLDPTNLHLARQNRRRLDFEPMRDALLASAGRLDPAVGGKPVPLEVAPFPTRRALYGFIDRYNLDPIYRTFDFPNPDTSSPRRTVTIVPQQALYLLNSPFVAEQSRHLAARSEVASGAPEDRVRALYRLLFGREPAPREVEVGLSFASRPADPADAGAISPWHYGVGGVAGDKEKARVDGFRPFTHWTGQAWQFGPKVPDPVEGHATLTPAGGHVGPGPDKATVVRWVAPADMAVRISGTIGSQAKPGQGDGVRARVVSSRSGLLGSWAVHGGEAEAAIPRVEVRRGETIDFVVDCRANDAFDSYTLDPSIRADGPPPPGQLRTAWASRTEFHGPGPEPLTPWEAYAQALLLTNEYLYID